MKNIEIDEELYQHIVRNTQYIGETASSILHRLLALPMNEKKDRKAEKLSVSNQVVDKIKEENNGNVFNFINKEELVMQRGAVGRFLLILAGLYRAHPESFDVVTDISGRERLYFATSASLLAERGSNTKPRQIPNSPFWVITNSNTTRKKMMLTKAAIALGYDDTHVEEIRELL